MQCVNCGKPLAPQVPEACPHCAIPIVMREKVQSGDGGVRLIIPVGRSGLSIAAGYAGLLCLVIVPGPLALMLGILALMDFRKHPEKYGRGRAWFGVIAGAIATILLGVIGVAIWTDHR